MELSSEDEAWKEATRACGEMIAELDGDLPLGKEWKMEVADELGPLFAIRFCAERLRRE